MSNEHLTADDLLHMSDAELSQLDYEQVRQLQDNQPADETVGGEEATKNLDQTHEDEDVSAASIEDEGGDDTNYEAGSVDTHTDTTETEQQTGLVIPSLDKPDTAGDDNYKAQAYDQIMSEFKANGKMMQVSSPEDAIQLMQMGANYRQKMLDLKPARKVFKLLQDNNMLDEGVLGHLIDLHNRKPEAIAKLIKDADFDTYSIDEEALQTYNPSSTNVSDSSLELDDILGDMFKSEYGQRAVHVITSEWDEASRRYFADNPHDMRIIENHMQDGTFDKIMQVVAQERTLGRLEGITDLDAYKAIGGAMAERGMISTGRHQQQPIATKKVAQQATSNKARKAAASPASASKEAQSGVVNYMAMSDAEFEKMEALRLK